MLDRLLATLAPYECLGCGCEGTLLCPACSANLEPAVERCYRCQQPSQAGLTCALCQGLTSLCQVQAVTPYKGLAKDLVWKLKSAGAQDVGTSMAGLMLPFLEPVAGVILVPVPTATSRVRQRGYDQAVLLARAIASQAKLPYAQPLVRSGQAHQLGANRAQRLEQLAGAFRTRQPIVVDKQIILIDDVTTTGATLEAAAKVLKQAGATSIKALTFAQA